MPAPPKPTGFPVHPHQLEVLEFSSYALVIDARSRREYEEDHIPGAVNIPVGTAALPSSFSAEGGAGSAGWRVSEPMAGLPYALSDHVQELKPEDCVLVYCSRGGLDSLVWAEPLRVRGWTVDILGGGWPNYRRWVEAGFELLPRALVLRLVAGPPAGGVSEALGALADRGGQTVDIASLGSPRLIPGMVLPGEIASQLAFESLLLDALRQMDPAEVVWISGLAPESVVRLPSPLEEQLERAPLTLIEAPMEERARAWHEHLLSLNASVLDLVERLSTLPSAPPALVKQWRSMAEGLWPEEALASILRDFLDPAYRKLARRDGELVALASLDPVAVGTALARLASRRGQSKP